MSNEAETSLVLAEGRVRDSSTTLGMTQWKPLVGGFPNRPRRVRAGLARPIRERFWDRAPFTSGHTRRPILLISRLRFARCVVSAVSAEARICAGTAHATDAFHLLVGAQCPGVVVQNNPAGLEHIAIMRNL